MAPRNSKRTWRTYKLQGDPANLKQYLSLCVNWLSKQIQTVEFCENAVPPKCYVDEHHSLRPYVFPNSYKKYHFVCDTCNTIL